VSKSTGPGDPLLNDPTAFIFTDGSALPNGSAEWGFHITFSGIAETYEIWGPVSTSPTGRHWLGARRATSNTGELSALYYALDWIRRRRKSLDPASSPRYNLVSESFYCVKLFTTRAIKPVANKHIIARLNTLLDQVKRDNSISISWIPAHTNSDDPLAQGNAVADKLAARPSCARRFSSGLGHGVGPRCHWRAAARSAPPRLPPFDSRQPHSWRAFLRRLARRFRSLTRPAPPVHDYNGDLVGD